MAEKGVIAFGLYSFPQAPAFAVCVLLTLSTDRFFCIRCHPMLCKLLDLRIHADSIPFALTI
jgi:hypothetical protein